MEDMWRSGHEENNMADKWSKGLYLQSYNDGKSAGPNRTDVLIFIMSSVFL